MIKFILRQGFCKWLPLALILSFPAPSTFSQISTLERILAGRVMDTVWCKQSPHQSYAVYLPKGYTPLTSWPAIFLYDPGARGSGTVAGYQAVAESFQCILICSNNSRNGPVPLIRDAEDAVWQDANARFALSRDKLFISGFSGGARSAVDLALRRKVYSGIIACGAGFPSDRYLSPKDSIPFIEVIGNEDMNLDEAFEINQYLEKINHSTCLLLFEGPHAWPPARVYKQAVFWQFLQLAKKSGDQIADSMVNKNESELLSLIAQEIDSGDFYLAHLNASQAISEPVRYSPSVEAMEKLISTNPKLTLQQNEFPKLLNKEALIKGQFSELYSGLQSISNDSDFKLSDWKNLFSDVNDALQSKNRLEIMMGKRIQNWMLLVGNSEFKNQFQIKDYFHASLLAQVLSYLENNYTSYLRLARTYAARGMKKESLAALKKSLDLGLTDKKSLDADPFLSTLQDEKIYKEIITKLISKQDSR